MRSKGVSITLDNETFRMAQKLASLSNKSIPDIITELIRKERNTSDFKITRGVKKISGLLKTQYDYKTLRAMYVADNMEKYESLD